MNPPSSIGLKRVWQSINPTKYFFAIFNTLGRHLSCMRGLPLVGPRGHLFYLFFNELTIVQSRILIFQAQCTHQCLDSKYEKTCQQYLSKARRCYKTVHGLSYLLMKAFVSCCATMAFVDCQPISILALLCVHTQPWEMYLIGDRRLCLICLTVDL